MSLQDKLSKVILGPWVKRPKAASTVTVVSPARPARSTKRVNVSRIVAAFSAWRAVKAGIHIVEHLAARLDEYWKERPRNSQPVPEMSIDADGELVVGEAALHPLHRLAVDPTSAVDDSNEKTVVAAETAIERAQSDTVSAIQAGDLEDAERKAAAAEERRRQVRAQKDELENQSSQSFVRSAAALENGTSAPAAPRERPPSLLLIWSNYVGMAVLLVTEFAQIAAPLLNTGGIDTSAIDREFWRAPFTVSMWTATAVGLTLAMFAVAGVAIDRAARVRLDLPRAELVLNLGLAGAMAAILAAVLAIIAKMRADLAAAAAAASASLYHTKPGETPSPISFFVLALVTLLASALLHRIGRHLKKKRAELLRQAEARTREQVAAEGRAALLEKINAELVDLDAQIDESRERIRTLMFEGQVHHEVRRDRAQHDLHAVEQFVDDVRAAIARHRIAFIHAAKKRKRFDLLRPDTPVDLPAASGAVVRYDSRGRR